MPSDIHEFCDEFFVFRTMPDSVLYDIIVHFNGSVSHILNVNPYKYDYMQLLTDALTNVPGNFGVGLNLYFTNTHTKSKMEVKSNQGFIEMFSSNSSTKVINIFLKLDQLLPSFVVTDTPTSGEGHVSGSGTSTRGGVGSNIGNRLLVFDDLFSNVDDYNDVDWTGLGDFEFNKADADEENAYIISDEDDEDTSDNDEGSNGSNKPIEANDEGMSDNESDDIGGKHSTDEEDVQGVNVDRYMRGEMFETKKWEKITLEKGMIFDVYHFRTVLQEFAIERGFKLIKIKNEKKRVTSICAS